MQGYSRGAQTGWRKIGRETIILDFQRKKILGLNEAAGWMWAQITTPKPLAWFHRCVTKAGLTSSESELEAFLDTLLEAGLIHLEPLELEPKAPEDLSSQAFDEIPRLLWEEPLQQVAGTCALISGMSVLCNQAPFS